MPDLYTIGYANKKIDDFLSILKFNQINCLIDVRTMPLSSQFPEYDEKTLKKILNSNGIIYMSFKREFGARRFENEVYEKIKMFDDSFVEVVIFKKVYELDIFKQGVRRVERGIEQGYKICFLCSEKYAYDCHRCIMVGEYFNQLGYKLNHIIDSSNYLNQNNIDDSLKKNFYIQKQKFDKFHSEDLKKLTYGGGLFETENNLDESFNYWHDFFETFTREKSIYLRNLEIGYKKGKEENE
ncbi:MAG: DUF488 domain-containing protein [Anaeroplasma bactoclasticum]|nr:DUF488 domain-containing protein [Anaeroplasma bactoclasticum]MCM1557772.1 DUF488 domain-containing protein [Anaeroplasma bactoclasticum]